MSAEFEIGPMVGSPGVLFACAHAAITSSLGVTFCKAEK